MATVSMNVTNGLVPVVMRGSIAALKPLITGGPTEQVGGPTVHAEG